MWQELTVVQKPLLRRAVEIVLDCAPLGEMLSVDRMLAAERSGIMRGDSHLFYFGGDGFELVVHVVYQPKSDRHQVCYAVAGEVGAQQALDLIVDKTHEYMLSQGISYVYGCRPKKQRSELLKEIYDLAALDEHVEEILLADRPDMWIFRIAYRPAAPS
jgi:hypothetical protein